MAPFFKGRSLRYIELKFHHQSHLEERMKNFILTLFCIYGVIGLTSIVIGLDLRKWYSWAIGAFGFIVGFLLSLTANNRAEATAAGLMVAAVTLTSGAVTWSNKQRSRSLLENNDSEKRSIFIHWKRLLKKLFHS